MQLGNRLVMSSITTTYASDALLPSERLIGFLEERARGGVGLITLEACTIDRRHREVPRCMHFASDDVIPAHRELTDRIHAFRAAGSDDPVRVQPQLTHPGPDGLAPLLEGIPSVGPSVIPSALTGTPCRPLESDEIGAIAGDFGRAARRIREAGYDGLELHAAHGYMLLGSFLSPLRNHREDAYTGSTEEGRTRIVLEVLDEIRAQAGCDFPVTLRISGYERVPGGRSIHDTQRIAPLLADAGVDCFHVSGGSIDRLTSQIVAGSSYPAAHNVAAAAAVKRVVDVPVMTVGRIHDAATAERILERGDADLIAMARPLLADPDLPVKVRGGRGSRVRPCISCQTCIDSMETGSMACAVNARSGREARLQISAAERSKRVVVVGAGPAGLEAARVATLRGHEVTLLESQHRLGGSLVFAAIVHPENQPLLDFLLGEVERLAIDVRRGRPATPERIAALRPDAVIVATGGRVVTPRIAGYDQAHVLTGLLLRAMLGGELDADAGQNEPENKKKNSGDNGDKGNESEAVGASRLPLWQRLAARALGTPLQRLVTPARVRALSKRWMPLGQRVAVVGADLAAVELAEFLASRGRSVAVLERGPEIAPEVGLKRRTEHMDRLDRLGVSVNTGVQVTQIERNGLRLRRDGATSFAAADSVILAGEVTADTELFEALRERVEQAHAIGDCTGLGLIRKATADAVRVACAI
jgi:2,4-dienoyl-CoA reductase (NADPH2)